MLRFCEEVVGVEMGHDMGMEYVFKEFAKDRSDGDGW